MISTINAEELEKYLKSQYKHTSSFVSGISLAFIDKLLFMLSICIGFFIVNAVDPACINFRSFLKYSVFLPAVFIVFYLNGLYPGILLAPEDEVRRFSLSSFFILIGEAFALTTIKSTKDLIPIAVALVLSWPFATILLPLGRELSRRFFAKFSWWGVPAVVYNKDDRANLIVDRLLKKKYLGYRPILIVTDSVIHKDEFLGIKIVEQSAEISAILKKINIKVGILCGFNKNLE